MEWPSHCEHCGDCPPPIFCDICECAHSAGDGCMVAPEPQSKVRCSVCGLEGCPTCVTETYLNGHEVQLCGGCMEDIPC